MDRACAEIIIQSHIKPLYGFALKRCSNPQDAEDLAQEIALRAFRALCIRDDIENTGKYVWTIAHNTLANHYRSRSRLHIGLSLDDMADMLAESSDISEAVIANESAQRLRSEIAYLSNLQRQIVIAYYYENRRQADIAQSLGIPVGTVKWHLFEAKKELKRGMETMRNISDLKFNPVKFTICGTNGSIGTMGGNYRFFRSALSQNIAYAAYRKSMSIHEIADALGVSPVYVESEVEHLAEYGFMLKKGCKYLTNIIIEEDTPEIIELHNTMYAKASSLFANELYDMLSASDIWDDPALKCSTRDRNYLMWTLIPYIAAQSGESMLENRISFDEAATLRPDGGHNICYAMIENFQKPMHMESMQKWCGPCWNASDDLCIWLCDSEWSERRMNDLANNPISRDLQLLSEFKNGGNLSKHDMAYLVQQGYLHNNGRGISYGCIWLETAAIRNKLLGLGDEIRKKHTAELEDLKKSYIKAVLESTPAHMRKAKEYGMQYIFYADGWFTLGCLKELVGNGRLKLPSEEQKNSLTMLIISER